jgi:pyruvate formate lyase activating enzyme
MENRAVINKIIHFSNVDGPGNRLAIFFQGCNVSCIYCHNPETINKCINCMECIPNCPTGAIKAINGGIVFYEDLCTQCDQCIKTCKYNSSPRTKEYSTQELFEIIKDYKAFIRGITVSGGEPTLQAEFIVELFKLVKPLGLTCFVDTNNFFDVIEISELINVTDKFMVDIKAVDKLDIICNCSFRNNIENLKYLLKINKVYEVRTVIVLNYLDIENTISKVAEIIKDYPEVIYKLIKVHSYGLSDKHKGYIKDSIPSEDYINVLCNKVKEIGVKKVEIIMGGD